MKTWQTMGLGSGSDGGVALSIVSWEMNCAMKVRRCAVTFVSVILLTIATRSLEADPLEHWVQSLSDVKYLEDVTFGGGRFVAVGSSAQIRTSTDCVNWNLQQPSPYYSFYGITYADGEFMVVGLYPDFQLLSRGCFGLSSDAQNWTINPVYWTVSFFTSVAYGNNVAVLTFYPSIPQSGLCYSTNLADWTPAAGDGYYSQIAFGDNRFVAVGDYGAILTSTNGSEWIAVDSGVTNSLYDISYGNGCFIAVGEAGAILRSSDGNSWIQCVSPAIQPLYSIAFGAGVFLAAGIPASEVLASTDGAIWKLHATDIPDPPSGVSRSFHALAFGLGRFVGIIFDYNYAKYYLAQTHIYMSGRVQIELSGRFLQEGNKFELSSQGGLDGSYLLQSSTNLNDWTDLLVITNTVPTSVFIDTSRSNVPNQFFRAVTQ